MKNATPNLFRGGFLPLLLFIPIILFSCSKDLESPVPALPTTLEAKLDQNPQYIELRQYWSSAYEKTFNDSLLRNDSEMSLRDQFLTYMEFRYSKLNSFLSDNVEYAEKRTEIYTLLSEPPVLKLTKGWDGDMGEARVDGGAVGELNDFISKIDASRRGFFTNCPTNNNLNATAEFITYLHRYSGHSTMSNFVSLTANFTSKIPWGMYEMYKDRLPNPPQIRNMHAEFKIILMKPYVKDTHKRMGYTCCSKSGGSSGGSGGTVPSTNPDKEPCNDAKCPTCGKCLNPSKSNCVKCVCVHVHDHKTCDMCNKCYKEQGDICSLTTKSLTHSSSCGTCDCWNEINQDRYATKEARARAELHYINSRGGSDGKSFVRDMEDLLNELQSVGTKMGDVYPLYDFIHKKFLELKGVYMLMISNSFLEYGSIIIDLAYLHSVIEETFLVYRNFVKRKMNVELSRSAWTGAKGSYFEPLGRGSTAQLPGSRANPINLNEELVIKEVKSNPVIGKCIKEKLKDARWMDWNKYQHTHKLADGIIINLHYNVKTSPSGIIEAIDDLKFIL